jgi:hypothetical protein
MLSLFRDGYFRAFLVGFVIAGVPMATSAGLFS